jgi:MPBQ/MSBQ methyltransferase
MAEDSGICCALNRLSHQSPHQHKKTKAKPELNGCTLALGDAEQIPYEADRFDRYVSAGSLEYWPDPAQGIEGWAIG